MPTISQASEFFKSLPKAESDAFDILSFLVGVDNPLREQEWLDYKSGYDEAPRATFSKGLSGFANSGGGILIWGIQTKQKDKYDVPDAIVLVDNPTELAGKLESWKSTVVDPPVRYVEIRSVRNSEGKGFVVAYIPESQAKPHQAKDAKWNDRYFIRIGHQTEPISQSLLKILFYPQFNPQLELNLNINSGTPKEGFMGTLNVRNIGSVTVSEIFIVIRQRNGLLPFAHNEKRFAVEGQSTTIINLSGERCTIHPELSHVVGEMRIFGDADILVAVFAKDMKPFRWTIKGTTVAGKFEITPAL